MDKFVLKVAVEYKNSMSNFGINFNFPKADNIVNTYSYRTFNAFVNKCRSLHLEEVQILEVIRIVVKYMSKNRLMKKGTGILSSPDIVSICVNELKGQINRSDDISKIIIESNKYLSSFNVNKTEYLLKKVNKGGFANLVMLRSKGILPDVFICCSRSCMVAYHKLETSDKAMLLTAKDYIILRLKLVNSIGAYDIKTILGDDSNV